ncbi:MAG: hypothetical protein ACFFB8_01650 [Promethearchaeota archaeon]
MKKKRTIAIKKACLRRIRNNLRIIILKANTQVQLRILEEIERIKQIPEYYENHPPELLNQVQELYDKEKQIERIKRASILLCPACFKSDKDMTYNPVRKEWYCTECYAKLKKGFTEDGEPEQFP